MEDNFEVVVDMFMKSRSTQSIGIHGENSYKSYERFLKQVLLEYSDWLKKRDKES